MKDDSSFEQMLFRLLLEYILIPVTLLVLIRLRFDTKIHVYIICKEISFQIILLISSYTSRYGLSDKLRASRTALSSADIANEFSLGVPGEAFAFHQCLNKISVAETSGATGDISQLELFIREYVKA